MFLAEIVFIFWLRGISPCVESRQESGRLGHESVTACTVTCPLTVSPICLLDHSELKLRGYSVHFPSKTLRSHFSSKRFRSTRPQTSYLTPWPTRGRRRKKQPLNPPLTISAITSLFFFSFHSSPGQCDSHSRVMNWTHCPLLDDPLDAHLTTNPNKILPPF